MYSGSRSRLRMNSIWSSVHAVIRSASLVMLGGWLPRGDELNQCPASDTRRPGAAAQPPRLEPPLPDMPVNRRRGHPAKVGGLRDGVELRNNVRIWNIHRQEVTRSTGRVFRVAN